MMTKLLRTLVGKNMAIIGRDFVCSRERFRAAKHVLRKDRVLSPRPITREGCKAMRSLAVKDGSTWVVTKFVQEHNHKLMPSCKFPGELLMLERERSSTLQQQLNGILKDLEEHVEFMTIRVEDIIKIMKELEFEDG